VKKCFAIACFVVKCITCTLRVLNYKIFWFFRYIIFIIYVDIVYIYVYNKSYMSKKLKRLII